MAEYLHARATKATEHNVHIDCGITVKHCNWSMYEICLRNYVCSQSCAKLVAYVRTITEKADGIQ
jgi:hypothetical protein